jgi:hypothetical protein
MSQPAAHNPPSPPLVALAGWLVPGGGYRLIGHRARAVTTGVTILLLLLLGLLIGGVRALEVPGWDADGAKVRLNAKGEKVSPEYIAEYAQSRWVMLRNPLVELRSKPWAIAQVLTGPAALAAGAWSVWASADPDGSDGDGEPPGAVSHGRVNEIGVLYTAVAGMLNLLTIIDASHRASQPQFLARPQRQPRPQPSPAPQPPTQSLAQPEAK